MDATFQYCLDNHFLGVGWRVEELASTEDWEVYEQAAMPKHESIQQPRYIYNNVQPGDLVWTRGRDGQYYLARVTSPWEYWTSAEGRERDIDIANIFRCDFHKVQLDAVPGAVVVRFDARGKSIQRIKARSARAYSQYLWNRHAKHQVYDVDTADFPDIFTMLDPEETEDLVFLYLQSQGWYVVPNSRKVNTLRFEFMLVHPKTREKALTQVKGGDDSLNVDCYAKDSCHIFLFQSNGKYDGQPADNVTCITRDDLNDFLQENVRWFPESFQNKLKIVEGYPAS